MRVEDARVKDVVLIRQRNVYGQSLTLNWTGFGGLGHTIFLALDERVGFTDPVDESEGAVEVLVESRRAKLDAAGECYFCGRFRDDCTCRESPSRVPVK